MGQRGGSAMRQDQANEGRLQKAETKSGEAGIPDRSSSSQSAGCPQVLESRTMFENSALRICLYSRSTLHVRSDALQMLRAVAIERQACLDEREESVTGLQHPDLLEFRGHSGQHFRTQAIIDQLPAFSDVRRRVMERVESAMAARKPWGWLYLGFKCSRGMLESVAVVELLARHLCADGHEVNIAHLSRRTWQPHCAAGTCGWCSGA